MTNGSCKCEACGLRFRSLSAFEMHRIGSFASGRERHTRRCLGVEEMRAKGMRQAENGAWVTGLTFGSQAA